MLTRHQWATRMADSIARVDGPSHLDRERGRQAAMREDVLDLDTAAGVISGRVSLERRKPALVTITIDPWGDDVWAALLPKMAAELRTAAELLAGRLPANLEEMVESIGAELLPKAVDLTFDSGDPVAPWRAAAAIWAAWCRAADADPLLVFALRGRDRANLLAALRALRSGADEIPVAVPSGGGVQLVAELGADRFTNAGDLDTIRVHPQPPTTPQALLRHLGVPPGVKDEIPLERIIQRAAETAWTLAAEDGSDEADDEVILGELRARGMATAAKLAEAVGWDAERATEVLDRLYGEGTVMRGGTGEKARYRA